MSDMAVSMRFYTGAGQGYPGILPRFQDKDNFYYFQMQVPNNKLVFSKRVNGSDTPLETVNYAFAKDTWYTLKVVLSGTTIRGYIAENGSDRLVFDLVDTTYGSGTVGIRNKWQSVHADDVTIAEQPPGNDIDSLLLSRRLLRFHCNGLKSRHQPIACIVPLRLKAVILW